MTTVVPRALSERIRAREELHLQQEVLLHLPLLGGEEAVRRDLQGRSLLVRLQLAPRGAAGPGPSPSA